MAIIGRLTAPFSGSEIERTVKRFPLSVVCMFAFFLLCLYAEVFHGIFGDFLPRETIPKIMSVLACGYFAGGCIRLVAESKGWSRTREYLLTVALTSAVGIGIVFITAPVYLVFWICFFLLFVMVAPYISCERDDVSLWCYNREVWMGFSVGFIAALLLAGGLQAAFAAVDYLFGIKTSHHVAVYIWSFAISILGPFYTLSCVPHKLRFENADCDATQTGLSFILNWLLAPLAIIYFLILYAYAAKIIVQMELPKGQLAYMITGFGGVGVIIYLLGWPIREKGTRLLTFLYKHFFKMLILPVLLLAIGIGTRISEYGITEDRYIIALATVWFAILCALYAFQARPLKWMPLSLLILFAVAVSGPWGAVPVSTYSQAARLESLLVKNKILVDGKIVPATSKIAFEDEKSISSIVEYLVYGGRAEKLPWAAKGEYGEPSTREYLAAIGLEYVSPYEGRRADILQFNTGYEIDRVINVKGYAYFFDGGNVYAESSPSPDANRSVFYVLEKEILTVTVKGQGSLAFDLSTVATKENAGAEKPEPLVLEARQGKLKGRLLINNMQYRVGTPPEIQMISFRLLLDY